MHCSQLAAVQHTDGGMKLFRLLSRTPMYASSLFPGTLTPGAKLSAGCVSDWAFNLNLEPTGRRLCPPHGGEARAKVEGVLPIYGSNRIF